MIVPRKPERFEEVARLIARRGFACIRRSERPDGSTERPDGSIARIIGADSDHPAVRLGDTFGELRKFYALADVVFVGRTLVDLGGSDPMEVAALGKPVVVGPFTQNFREPVEALRAAGAVRTVTRADELAGAVGELLRDRSQAGAMGDRARTVVLENQGATRRTVERLASLLVAPGGGSTAVTAPRRRVQSPAR
jgi:3-deoxy-D-manno-octulosonic-acid transferase